MTDSQQGVISVAPRTTPLVEWLATSDGLERDVVPTEHGQSQHVVVALMYVVSVQADVGSFVRAGSPEQQPPPTMATRCLTRREREVATLITNGLTNRQIAEQLVIAERTADTHVQNLLAKLGCASRTQVTAMLPTSTGGPSIVRCQFLAEVGSRTAELLDGHSESTPKQGARDLKSRVLRAVAALLANGVPCRQLTEVAGGP